MSAPTYQPSPWLPCSSCGVTVPPELLADGRCNGKRLDGGEPDPARCERWAQERKASERRIRRARRAA